ncbi:MAG: hypothetical protein COU11_00045 [Candidatus Harrisonbacteria bacterium CG10_big_fil_rev_8_21_14_0_10_49_15]|uniref:Uncharacterized protein n=1 Tax=Candidatus Harrisonbacteria bacterium CG10_big_fil_rev_8_21_14_0_10_49_15 TaxID=1974587 RepID=A0A2H0UM75_9BACT|nr:MAG: hypothetical protein COU11_00045 [Candidatus Harrisonbacteria bacterium CG10_big_fil_rev_8_21_14_0_10_49_15]
MFKQYLEYLKDNPQGYWFKRLGLPAGRQGWLVIGIGLALAAAGFYVGETDDAPGAALLGILLMLALVFTFGYWKGEKPRWQWGIPKKDDSK